MRIGWTAVAVVIGVSCGAPLGLAGGQSQVDFGVRVAGPVDEEGVPTHARVIAGVPFRLRVELFVDRPAGAASVSYDVDLPTGVTVARKPVRLRAGLLTSSCLRSCSIGWNTSQSRHLFVYYALVTPGPGEFIVEARIVSTGRSDARADDNADSATVVAVPARLTLGAPRLESGAPIAGRTFRVTLPVRRAGVAVTPTHARCLAAARGRTFQGVVTLGRGLVGCSWQIPSGSAGATLRTTVTVTAGSLRASTTWAFAIRSP